MKSHPISLLALLCIVLFSPSLIAFQSKSQNPFEGTNPWPEIRRERIQKLLPGAMKSAGVDSWIVICRENDNDPLALHVGGENAGGSAAFLFFLKDGKVKSIAISPEGEAKALQDLHLHDEVLVIERGSDVWRDIEGQLEKYGAKRIAINSSDHTIADGLSFTQRTNLENALGAELASRLIPSVELVTEWLAVKLPMEIAILKKAAEITDQLEKEAYRAVVPGRTRDLDVALFIKKRMKELGVTDGWAPDQNPNVNSGPDRGHSNATEKIIMPGDVIQIDFGIKVFDVWVSDIQRFAYVLKSGETEAPADIKRYFANAVAGHRKVLAAMKPGVTGYDVDKVQRDWMKDSGSLPVMWGTGHPVGYWAHDAGPSLSGGTKPKRPESGTAAKILKPGHVFAYDGFFSWKLDSNEIKTISVEEMAVVTENGAEYLSEPQKDLILIQSGK